MGTNYATWTGGVTERLIRYYAERAQGGVGLINVEFSYVHPSGKASLYNLGIYDDALVPGLAQLAQAIHAGRAQACIQLAHCGRRGKTAIVDGPLLAPSPIPHVGGEVPRELDLDEIENVVLWFVQAARRARMANFDAVLLHVANGYLLNQFISPYSNRRSDRYGGSTEGRARLVVKIIEGIRRELGAEFPIICRVCVDEQLAGGLTLDEGRVIVRFFEQAGANAIEVLAGIPETQYVAGPPMAMPRGFLIPMAQAVKEAVSIPVIGVGRINDPILADEFIRQGKVDFISMGRALIADPQLPNKAMTGQFADICPCIACHEACSQRIFAGLDMSCVTNPRVGRENLFVPGRVSRPRRVLVVGGGPAGMMAALTAAERGHHVVLREQGSALGGQLQMGCVPPHKEEIERLLHYLVRKVEESNVEVQLESRMDVNLVRNMDPEVVIVATGARPLRPPLPGVGDHTVSAWDVLSGQVAVGSKVVVIGGGEVGCELAELLASSGKQVVILEMLDEIAVDMEPRGRRLLLRRLAKLGVHVLTQARVTEVTPGTVTYERAGLRYYEDGADTIVLATGSLPNTDLPDELKRTEVEFHCIGDCTKPRRILDAMREGFEVGFAV
jgi:2,4-dienoyl-CoA reductase-like NADH-dependent reductase (Old Yellow Enzyme family)/thioredoxin reductase